MIAGVVSFVSRSEGAGPGYFEQKERDLAVLNENRGFTIASAERFHDNKEAAEVPGPSAYNVHNRSRAGLTMGTGKDLRNVDVTIPKSKRDFSLAPVSTSARRMTARIDVFVDTSLLFLE